MDHQTGFSSVYMLVECSFYMTVRCRKNAYYSITIISIFFSLVGVLLSKRKSMELDDTLGILGIENVLFSSERLSR